MPLWCYNTHSHGASAEITENEFTLWQHAVGAREKFKSTLFFVIRRWEQDGRKEGRAGRKRTMSTRFAWQWNAFATFAWKLFIIIILIIKWLLSKTLMWWNLLLFCLKSHRALPWNETFVLRLQTSKWWHFVLCRSEGVKQIHVNTHNYSERMTIENGRQKWHQ